MSDNKLSVVVVVVVVVVVGSSNRSIVVVVVIDRKSSERSRPSLVAGVIAAAGEAEVADFSMV